MLLLLSPAKSLDFESPPPELPRTEPLFAKDAARLIRLLRQKSAVELARMMDLSDGLAKLNVVRYKAWRAKPAAAATRPALLAFDGAVYAGLDARSLEAGELTWAQEHLCILSGLYGVLRPLDALQPYRLEMSSPLANDAGANLYRFWGGTIAGYLNRRLAPEPAPVVVNLASQEYFKAVDLKALKARVVHCVFEEQRNGQYKVIGFMAKRARGLMARYAIRHRAATPEQLRGFQDEGYVLEATASTPDRLVFRRRIGAP